MPGHSTNLQKRYAISQRKRKCFEEVLGCPDGEFFKVRADDGNLYILRHHPLEGEWSLESFLQTAK
jgi:hypothetical protein